MQGSRGLGVGLGELVSWKCADEAVGLALVRLMQHLIRPAAGFLHNIPRPHTISITVSSNLLRKLYFYRQDALSRKLQEHALSFLVHWSLSFRASALGGPESLVGSTLRISMANRNGALAQLIDSNWVRGYHRAGVPGHGQRGSKSPHCAVLFHQKHFR